MIKDIAVNRLLRFCRIGLVLYDGSMILPDWRGLEILDGSRSGSVKK